LGRDRYARAALTEDARPGSRNGYREVTVKTTAGPVALARPKLRGTSEAFVSRLFGSHVTKTNALESLVNASFVRGLSVRDVEATLAEALGDQAAISKSTVSAICGQIKDEYQAWVARRLDQVALDYLFLDASFFRMHPGSPAEPVLAAWGITTGGKPAFIGLAPGTGESFDAWKDFLADLRDRGLASPLLVISDGAPGLIGAIEQIYPRRCVKGALFIARERSWPRSRPGCRPRSRTRTGRSSTPASWPPRPAPGSWRSSTAASMPSPPSTGPPTRPRSSACSPTARA
jgi:putative transposase